MRVFPGGTSRRRIKRRGYRSQRVRASDPAHAFRIRGIGNHSQNGRIKSPRILILPLHFLDISILLTRPPKKRTLALRARNLGGCVAGAQIHPRAVEPSRRKQLESHANSSFRPLRIGRSRRRFNAHRLRWRRPVARSFIRRSPASMRKPSRSSFRTRNNNRRRADRQGAWCRTACGSRRFLFFHRAILDRTEIIARERLDKVLYLRESCWSMSAERQASGGSPISAV